MNKETTILIAAAFLLIGSAATGVFVLNEFYKANAPRTCADFIQVGYIWLPEKVSSLFMDDNLILHFSTVNNDNITVYGRVSDHGIFDLGCQPQGKPDAEVWMSDYTAIELATSTHPITTFVTGWRDGTIKIKTYNSQTKKKLSYADYLLQNDYEPVPPAIRAIFARYVG